jgi:SHS2 domain-containing protein
LPVTADQGRLPRGEHDSTAPIGVSTTNIPNRLEACSTRAPAPLFNESGKPFHTAKSVDGTPRGINHDPMSRRFEFFDHTADIGVHIYGATLPELFANAAAALYEALGRLAKAEERTEKSVKLEAPTLEDLLHDWLSELLYEVEANHMLYDEISLLTVRGSPVPDGAELGSSGREAAHTCELRATLRGGTIDFERSQTNEEIKAVTYHHLQVEQLPDATWRATVILDV